MSRVFFGLVSIDGETLARNVYGLCNRPMVTRWATPLAKAMAYFPRNPQRESAADGYYNKPG